jgi:hypothetical protein
MAQILHPKCMAPLPLTGANQVKFNFIAFFRCTAHCHAPYIDRQRKQGVENGIV